jgi:hypothetical protein
MSVLHRKVVGNTTNLNHVKEKKDTAQAVPRFRRLVAGLPPRMPGFDPGSVHVASVVEKVALGQVFPPSTSVFHTQFHSTAAPLLEKMKNTDHLSSSSQGCTISLKAAVSP